MVRFEDACGKVGKTLVVRLLPGTDVIEGIEAACLKNDIKYAYVSCFGSFSKIGYMYMVPKAEAKVGSGYGAVLTEGAPIEFLNGTGLVCQNNGKYDTHFHATMCDKTGKVFGGHVVKGHSSALTTVDMIIFEVNDVQMLRAYDEETDLTQFVPKAK